MDVFVYLSMLYQLKTLYDEKSNVAVDYGIWL